jgi:hypothetical protein
MLCRPVCFIGSAQRRLDLGSQIELFAKSAKYKILGQFKRSPPTCCALPLDKPLGAL